MYLGLLPMEDGVNGCRYGKPCPECALRFMEVTRRQATLRQGRALNWYREADASRGIVRKRHFEELLHIEKTQRKALPQCCKTFETLNILGSAIRCFTNGKVWEYRNSEWEWKIIGFKSPFKIMLSYASVFPFSVCVSAHFWKLHVSTLC